MTAYAHGAISKMRWLLPSYRGFRPIRSKGAALVLLWDCLVPNYYLTAGNIWWEVLHLDKSDGPLFTVGVALGYIMAFVALIYPAVGWIADVYTGRYRMVQAGLWLMWIGTVLMASFVVLALAVPSLQQESAWYAVIPVGMVISEVGDACYRSNVVQFGTDQLIDSPSGEISAFINWHFLAFSVSFVIYLPFLFVFNNYLERFSMLMLMQAAFLSIALLLNILCRHWLLIEPETRNPFKMVLKVSRYALNTKNPERRSAFTYDLQKIPSRFEYAKPEYGGPFTVEQVEDVKTFFNIFFFLIPAGILLTVGYVAYRLYTLMAWHIDTVQHFSVKLELIGYSLPFLTKIFGLLLLEFILCPLFYHYIPNMFWRFGIGTVMVLFGTFGLLSLDVAGHCVTGDTVPSLFTKAMSKLDISYYWLIPIGMLIGMGMVLQATSSFEFVIAQSPYNMKGLMIGVLYAVIGVAGIIMLLLRLPFTLGGDSLSTPSYHAGSIYATIISCILLVLLVVYIVAAKLYKKRERDPPDNRHVSHVEEYYDKYLSLREHTIF